MVHKLCYFTASPSVLHAGGVVTALSFPLTAIKASSRRLSEIPDSFRRLALKTTRVVSVESALPLLPYGTNMGFFLLHVGNMTGDAEGLHPDGR